jgi:acid phosphatase
LPARRDEDEDMEANPMRIKSDRTLSRRRRFALASLASLALLGAASAGASTSWTLTAATPSTPSASTPCHTGITPVTINHVVVVMEENESESSVIGSSSAPYLNSVASTCGLAANYHNASHPSLPNYVDLTSGSVQGSAASKDCNYSGCPQSQNNIFAELDAKGLSWKAYAESATSDCQTSNTTLYAQRHVPAVYYTDIHSTSCKTQAVPMTSSPAGGPAVTSGNFYNDVHNGTLPALSFVSPNLCDDGHSYISTYSYCSSNRVKNLDNWLKAWVPFILNGPNYASGNTEVFIVFDEGGGADKTNGEHCWDQAHSSTSSYQSCWTTAVLVGPNTPQLKSSTWFNHFNTLDTITGILGVSTLTESSSTGGIPTPNSLRSTFHL